MKKPIVWTIAARDPTGLSGIEVDLLTLRNFNLDVDSIVTAVILQHDCSIGGFCWAKAQPTIFEYVAVQWDVLQRKLKPDAIKIGMLGVPAIEKMIPFLKNYDGFVVLDPILPSSSDPKRHVENLVKLLPFVDVVTPNRLEAETIVNCSLTSYDMMRDAAHALIALGAKSVFLKGGDVNDRRFSQDYWTNGNVSFWLANHRAPRKIYHGVGCVLSSAIAACLALGYSIKDAVVIAKMVVNRSIRCALVIDSFSAKLFHDGWPENQEDIPFLSPQPLVQERVPFSPCKVGFYPVIDSSHWLEKLLPQGVKCIQLRIKNKPTRILEDEINYCIRLAKQYGAILFVNDYWQIAIRLGADGVHLGQEDLLAADIDQIYQAGLHLGISTHCYYEVARAHTLHPSYIAFGPIYATTSKDMPFQPQGITQLQRWRRTLSYPLVAIGGISLNRLSEVLATGVNGIALISAVTKAADPLAATRQFLTRINGI